MTQRRIKNLNDLYICASQLKSENAEICNEEDKSWLQEALTHYNVDLSKYIEELWIYIKGKMGKPLKDCVSEDHLDSMLENCENFDHAKTFCLIGGFSDACDILENESICEENKIYVLALLKNCLFNNEFCQKKVNGNDRLFKLFFKYATKDYEKHSGFTRINYSAIDALSSYFSGSVENFRQVQNELENDLFPLLEEQLFVKKIMGPKHNTVRLLTVVVTTSNGSFLNYCNSHRTILKVSELLNTLAQNGLSNISVYINYIYLSVQRAQEMRIKIDDMKLIGQNVLNLFHNYKLCEYSSELCEKILDITGFS